MKSNTRETVQPGGTAFSIQHSAFSARLSRRARRGVLLLIVLALLAMFGLFAIGFVVIAGQAKRTSLQQQRIEQYYDPFDALLYQGALQVIRGSANRGSAIGPHGLLEDEYSEVPNTALFANDTHIKQNYQGALPANWDVTNPASPYIFAAGVFNIPAPNSTEALRQIGNVLTISSGRCRGMSTRIVGYTQSNNTLQVLAFDGALQPGPNDQFVINGAPFSGTGFGYNPYYAQGGAESQIMLTAAINGVPGTNGSQRYALLPNPLAFQPNASLQYTDLAGPGGANEDYDAPDYQNMILAGLAWNTTVTPNQYTVVSPSLHRPELVNYWINVVGSQSNWDNAPALQRRVILRPLRQDHPNFTGGNATPFDPVNGPWDVDNDGDGVPDSIWVDLGFPARPAANGKMYKPLFAILCLDLDGRLNVNAHGSFAQAQPDYYQNGSSQSPTSLYTSLDSILQANNLPGYTGLAGNLFADGGATTTAVLPRGQGYGPAEINLGPLLSTPPSNVLDFAAYQRLLAGTVGLDGRYGESSLWGATWAPAPVPAPGRTSASVPPAAPNYDPRTDPLGFNKFVDFPDNYLLSLIPGLGAVATIPGTPAVNQTSYGSIPDLKGTLRVGLDPRGQPIYDLLRDPATPGPMSATPVIPPSPFNFARTNHPYELNLSQKRSRGLPNDSPDNPFSVAEMERFFRFYDRDAARLPNRLALLTNSDPIAKMGLFDFAHQHEFTTESWSVPVPKTAYPAWLAKDIGSAELGRLYHPVDLARARLLNKDPAQATALELTQADQAIAQLLPLEFLAGRKMDLNRPWGNGRDDDAGVSVGSVVDEGVGPPFGETDMYYGSDANGNVPPRVFNYGGGATTGIQARQLYARHLYVLAQLLIDRDYCPPWITTLVPAERTEQRARWLAQWAVNVVDFRDRDSIMTRFQYMENPVTTNGWTIQQTDPVVWGCERPELLITETLAIHDRRSEDLSGDGGTTTDPDPQKRDSNNDFDQRLMPLGSLFVELFNPWSGVEADSGELNFDRPPYPREPSGPRDLPNPPGQWRGGVLLNQRTPGGHPVWRLVIVDAGTNGDNARLDPDNPDLAKRPAVERSVYLIQPPQNFPGPAQGNNDGTRFWSDQPIAPLKHNRYAVIGPGDATSGMTPIGERIDDPTKPRQIVLAPNVDADAANQVQVRYNRLAAGNDPLPGKPPVAVLVTQPRRLSVSEPVAGYPAIDPDGRPYDPINGYLTPYPQPLDRDDPIINIEGLTPGSKRVYLQRLANPIMDFQPDFDASGNPNPNANPYRTNDSMPIDLFAYNGVETHPDPTVLANPVPELEKLFHSRERGDNLTGTEVNNLWKAEPFHPRPDAANVAPLHQVDLTETGMQHAYTYVLQQTLGYLNKPFFPAANQPQTAPLEYVGDLPTGSTPFPWVNWNNRPFVSEMELLLVPWARSSQLLGMFDAAGQPPTFGLVPGGVNMYNPSPPEKVDFPHLNNFLLDGPPATPATASNLYRLLEFVGVPSRFVGTETFGNPTALAGGPFAPPFNAFATYREPGRINLNTIASENVFKGLLNRPDLGSNGLWDQFLRTRGLGYVPFDPSLPTRIVNPFRSYGGASLVPLAALRTAIGNDINATLLRPTDQDASMPLFLSNSQSGSPVNNTDRSPYFRYQELQRLANKVTTQSNVYAVWITVGYFEAEPNPGGIDTVHPDGYRLGAEIGSDTGEVKRHRGFFVIDRSIPVGFQRGRDLNVDKTILLKRYIE